MASYLNKEKAFPESTFLSAFFSAKKQVSAFTKIGWKTVGYESHDRAAPKSAALEIFFPFSEHKEV